MAEMGNYCKAYHVRELRTFDKWQADVSALRRKPDPKNPDADGERRDLSDDEILYIQENFVVTDGILKDEHIVFSDTTEEWKTFCREQLDFQVPDWEAEAAAIRERMAADANANEDATKQETVQEGTV